MGGAKVYRGSRAQLVRGQPLGTPSPPPDVFACLDFGVPPCPCLCMKHVYITDMHMHMLCLPALILASLHAHAYV